MTKVLLVGWDSADPDVVRELIAAGHMPCLARIIGAGSFGTLDSYEPYLSPMLWATIATGKDPEQHGIHGFAAIDPETGKAVPTSPAARRAKALWTLLSEQGKRCGVVGWLGSHPAEPVKGTYVADSFARHARGDQTTAPPPPGSVYPPERADDLAELRLAPSDVDLGLLGLFLPRLREIDLKADPRPGKLVEHLAELYTLHNAAVTLAAENQPDFLTVYFHFLDWVSHVFMPFHPPRMAGVNERDFELYQHVVTGAYRLQDLLLADLLRHCAADTNLVLVSDHGFASGGHRPAHTPHVAAGIAAWHRPQGIFAASGPAFLPQSRARGAALVDITPTILALFGLPRGEDMPGRVLTETLAAAAPLRTIPTWETSAPFALPPAHPAAPDAGGDALLRQFVQLGYLDASLLDSHLSAETSEEVRRQNQWNLGVALIAWGHPERALPHLHAAFLAEPESGQYAYHLARCLLLVGLTDEAARAATTLEDRGDDHPRACHLRAELALLAGRFSAVLTLAATGRRDPALARDCDRLTRTALIRLRRFSEARTSLETALVSEPRHALLHAGLALINFHQRDTAGAEAAARLALELQPQLPLAKRVLEAVAQRRGTSRPIRPELTWPELTVRALQRRRLREEFHHREKLWFQSKLQSRLGLAPVAAVPRELKAPAGPADVSRHDDFHLIVSGAPRSGTSLMMRMLAMAGMPVLTDGVRPPDDHNPHGYFEWELAKQLPRDPQLIAEAAGQAVKVVSPLLRHLPANRRYRVIFMRRDAGEISRSQQADRKSVV